VKYTIPAFIAVAAMSTVVYAGTIQGKVSGSKGESVVYVEAIVGKTFPAPSEHVLMDQKGLVFAPHVVVVLAGTTLDFQNSDSVNHNVFWPSVGANKKLGHNLGTWPHGEKRAFKFDTPGVVPLLCNVHPEMEAYVIVSPTPYFAKSDASGEYKIENIPDGTYTVTAWKEGAKPHTSQVTVSGSAKLDFTLTK
jgi:plastocyanin